MSNLDMVRAKARNAFTGTNGRNLSFDIWNFNSRQVVNSVNGTKDNNSGEFDYWTQREARIGYIS